MRNLFNKKKDCDLKENEVRVVLPEETYTLIEYESENLPCIATVNSGLVEFAHTEVFTWHLSVIIDYEEIVDNGMPTKEEQSIVDPFCDQLDEEIKAGGNALFLVRETWNKTRRLVWMVYDPEIADQHLNYIIEYHKYPRQFDYRMTHDQEWSNAEWYLNTIR